MNVDEMAGRFSDPILAIAKDILAEHRRDDITVGWFTHEISRRYGVQDQYLGKYLHDGGLGGLARRLLKRPIRIAVGADEVLRVPERLRIGRVYRPTLICTEAELSQNTRVKRRAIQLDVRAVRPLERLAELMKDAGTKTVGDTFGSEDAA